MDFKILIFCHKCECNFELRPEASACNEIICPNCSSKVSSEIASLILNGLHELGAVPESYSNNEDKTFPKDGFSFTVKPYSLFDGFKAD